MSKVASAPQLGLFAHSLHCQSMQLPIESIQAPPAPVLRRALTPASPSEKLWLPNAAMTPVAALSMPTGILSNGNAQADEIREGPADWPDFDDGDEAPSHLVANANAGTSPPTAPTLMICQSPAGCGGYAPPPAPTLRRAITPCSPMDSLTLPSPMCCMSPAGGATPRSMTPVSFPSPLILTSLAHGGGLQRTTSGGAHVGPMTPVQSVRSGPYAALNSTKCLQGMIRRTTSCGA